MTEIGRVLADLRRLGINVEGGGEGWLIRRPVHSIPGILRFSRVGRGWSLVTGPETGDDGPWDEWEVASADEVVDEVLLFVGQGLTDY
jgi:hypothetical protein